MSAANHTPGPWFVFAHAHRDEGPGSFSIGTNARVEFADILCSRFQWPERAAEMQANAALIAAAPDLLAALKLCAAVCAGETTNKNGLIAALEAARAALAKATGASA